MLKQRLMLSGYKYSIYVAISSFFFMCFLGYVSNVAVDTVMKKAIIAGCILGLVFFVSIKILINYVPDNLNMVERKNRVDTGKSEG
ncbi:MAG: hypothetical protein V3V70_04060 [Candidatus Scalindua sp.]